MLRPSDIFDLSGLIIYFYSSNTYLRMKKLIVFSMVMLFGTVSMVQAQSCCAKAKAASALVDYSKEASTLAAASKDIVVTTKDDVTSYFRQATNEKGETSLTEVIYHAESNSFVDKVACSPEEKAKCAAKGQACTPECAAKCAKAKTSTGAELKSQAIPVNKEAKITNQSLKTTAPRNTIHQ